MNGSVRGLAAIVLMAMGGWTAMALAEGGGGAGSAATIPGGDVLYEDSGGRSSATVTEVLPNSNTSQVTLENVRRIRVKGDILIIEWGGTSTTLLPRQYVGSININKRAEPASASAPSATMR